MTKIFKAVTFVFLVLLLLYVLPPSPEFPLPPSDSLQSKEMADTETPLRRAYFTNLTREEVMQYYVGQFNKLTVLNVNIPTYRLNYPPEESQTLIRDQTKSTYLEEIVHPLRESILINGFEPTKPQDAINIEARAWRQKIIVKYVPSSILVRAVIVIFSGVFVSILFKEWSVFFKGVADRREKI